MCPAGLILSMEPSFPHSTGSLSLHFLNTGNEGKVWDAKGLQAGTPSGHRDLMAEWRRKESRGPGCANTSGRELGVS